MDQQSNVLQIDLGESEENEIIDPVPMDISEPIIEDLNSPKEEQTCIGSIYEYDKGNEPSQITLSKEHTIRSFEMTVQVQSGITQYYENINYTIHSKLGNEKSVKVTRSYTHFEWLNNILREAFPGIIVPSIPPKSVLVKLKIAEQSNQLRDKRFYVKKQKQYYYQQLKEFLLKITNHPYLSQSQQVKIFFIGSLEEMSNQLMKMEQFHSYASQMSNLLVSTSTYTYGIAKSTVRFFSNYLSKSQLTQSQLQLKNYEANQDTNILFDSWEDLLINELERVKKINDNYNIVIQSKIEQAEQSKNLINCLTCLDNMNLLKERTEKAHYISNTILERIKQTILYPLELCVSDIQEGLLAIKKRQTLIQTIKQQIQVYNAPETLEDDKNQLKQNILAQQKQVNILETNFQSDIEQFTIQLNQQLQTLTKQYTLDLREICMEQQQIWNQK